MKAVVLFSGGLDSTTVLAHAIREHGYGNVQPLIMYYGQRHEKEIKAAGRICTEYQINPVQLNVDQLFAHSKSALIYGSEQQIPEEEYPKGQEPVTAVPFRNGVFLSVAASWALERGYQVVYCGIHQDDANAAYWDTSVPFFESMKKAIEAGTGGHVTLEAPFVRSSKLTIVRSARELHAPIGLSWSCYKGGTKPCGRCGTCRQRAEAFKLAGFKDPALEGKVYID